MDETDARIIVVALIIIAVLGAIIHLVGGFSRFVALSYYALIILVILLFIVGLFYLYRGKFSGDGTNATLTCKNGHTVRGWVDLTGWTGTNEYGVQYDLEIFEPLTIWPRVCPECGAEWSVPHSRVKRAEPDKQLKQDK